MRTWLVRIAVAGAIARSAFGQSSPNNVVLFVADGLRPGMVNDQTAPTIASLTKNGVQFTNTHSIFPTFTTANASAMATGHALGDTGLRASDQSRSGKSSRPDWDVNEFPRKTALNS